MINDEKPTTTMQSLTELLRGKGAHADPLAMGVNEAAESVVRVAVSNMYAASTKILSRAGVDPRDFALVAFGGAGPLVGSLLARDVGIPTVFVPRAPGTLCALGAITTDILNDAVRTVHGRLDALPRPLLHRLARGIVSLGPLPGITQGSDAMREIERGQRIIAINVKVRVDQSRHEREPVRVDAARREQHDRIAGCQPIAVG